MWRLRDEDVRSYALGAELFGSGGGGSTRAAVLATERLLVDGNSIAVLACEDLTPESWVLPVGLLGSVTVLEEKLPSGNEWGEAIKLLERYCGVQAAALMPLEAAGIAALLPLMACITENLPLVDADLMGRAFPGLNQTVLTAAGRSMAPLCLANDQAEVILIDRVNPDRAERYARSAVVEMGGWAAVAFAPLRVQDVRREAILGSVGRLALAGRRLSERRLEPLLRELSAQRLAQGRIIEIERSQELGYGRGSVTIAGVHSRDDLTIEFQNESLLAIRSGRVVAAVPDLICVLATNDMATISTEQFTYGMELDVICIPADQRWRTSGVNDMVGPAAFGYRLSGDGVDGAPV